MIAPHCRCNKSSINISRRHFDTLRGCVIADFPRCFAHNTFLWEKIAPQSNHLICVILFKLQLAITSYRRKISYWNFHRMLIWLMSICCAKMFFLTSALRNGTQKYSTTGKEFQRICCIYADHQRVTRHRIRRSQYMDRRRSKKTYHIWYPVFIPFYTFSNNVNLCVISVKRGFKNLLTLKHAAKDVFLTSITTGGQKRLILFILLSIAPQKKKNKTGLISDSNIAIQEITTVNKNYVRSSN